MDKSFQQTLAQWLNYLLVGLLGFLLAKFMWQFLSPLPKVNASVKSISSQQNITQVESKNYGEILAGLHLFGQEKVKTQVQPEVKQPVAPPVEQKPATVPVNLKLHGIIAYGNQAGYALISKDGGRQSVYSKSDEITENVSVYEIYKNKVIINNNGTSEDLLLPVSKPNEVANNSPSRTTSPTTNRRSAISSARNVLKRNASARTSAAQPSTSLADLRKRALNNPQELFKLARPSPAWDNGQFIGYRLLPGQNRKLFRELGLRAGDVVTQVNGIELNDKTKGISALSEVSGATTLDLVVKRGQEYVNVSHGF